MDTKQFGNRLASLRTEKGFTGKQLGDLIGADRSVVCQWEAGKCYPNNERLVRLAEILGVTTDYLLGRTDCSDSISVLTDHGEDCIDLSEFTEDQRELIKGMVRMFDNSNRKK